MQKGLLYFFSGLFILSVLLLIFDSSFTGHVTSDSTTSEVTISQYFSISLSGNLSNGIDFGTQNSTVATDVNATQNFNASLNTSYFIAVSSDSNTDVNFSISGDGPLNTTGGDEIGLGNETYAFSTGANNVTNPSISGETSLTTSPVAAGGDIAPGFNVYYRFWLDIPSGTPVGTYNNTINFNGAAA